MVTAFRSQPLNWFLLIAMIALHVALWTSMRDVKGRWQNVPPVPSANGAAAIAFGDRQFGYRVAGLTLQNLGNIGRIESFEEYDYSRLKDWFFMAHGLDERSNFVPYLAAYYFSAVNDPEKIRYLVDYLRVVGTSGPYKWRWLAQAVYLARFKMNDLDLAYELAVELAAVQDETLGLWAKQMPAFILTARGDKQMAYDMIVEMLKGSIGTMPREEINTMLIYLCSRVLEPEAAKADPLCQDIKW
jgi:hypothetical protein